MKRIICIALALISCLACFSLSIVVHADEADDYLSSIFDQTFGGYFRKIGVMLDSDFFDSAMESAIKNFDYDEGSGALIDFVTNMQYLTDENGDLVSAPVGSDDFNPVDDSNPLQVSGSLFSEVSQAYNAQYGPKTTSEYISWRSDKRHSNHAGTNGYLSFFAEGTFPHGKTDDIYMVGFYKNADGVFHSQVQLHFYQELTYDSSGAPVISLYVEYWDMIEKTDPLVELVTNQLATYRYLDFTFYSDSISFGGYQKYSDYITIAAPWTLRNGIYGSRYYWNGDCSVCADLPYGNPANGTFEIGCTYNKTVAAHDEVCSHGCDYGYYISLEPIEMNFDGVDWSQFTDDDIVTLSGDTFYDYTITNTTTGDSTTVNNYITNNYNYPVSDTDNGEEGGSSSAGAGGNVNVSGDISVGGQVDVNVNVNQDNTTALPDVDGFVDYIEQPPDGFTAFMSQVFAFMPPEVLGLLLAGISAAVICRVLGR